MIKVINYYWLVNYFGGNEAHELATKLLSELPGQWIFMS